MSKKLVAAWGFGLGSLYGAVAAESLFDIDRRAISAREEVLAAVSSCAGALSVSEAVTTTEIPEVCKGFPDSEITLGFQKITISDNGTGAEETSYILPTRDHFVEENPVDSVEEYKRRGRNKQIGLMAFVIPITGSIGALAARFTENFRGVDNIKKCGQPDTIR